MTNWPTDITPEMDAAIDAELAKAPPLTPERVRRILIAGGASLAPRDERDE
jgi:hypothetical protein